MNTMLTSVNSQLRDMFGIIFDVGDHVMVSLTGSKLGVGRIVAIQSSPQWQIVVALAIPTDILEPGKTRQLRGELLSFSNPDSIVYLTAEAYEDITRGEYAEAVISEQEDIWKKAHTPQPVVPEPVDVLDMNNERLTLGDWVVTPNNGPYLVYGRVVGMINAPRGGVELLTAERPENDPAKAYEAKLRTVNSPSRLVKLPPPYPHVHGDKLEVIELALNDLHRSGWISTGTVTRMAPNGNG